MRYRNLGATGIRVSEVGFGVWTVSTGMWGITDHAVGCRLLQRAADLGVTFFDTADVYGDGKGETLVADALGHRRDDLVLATKFGYDFYNHPGAQPGQRERPQDWSPDYIRRACTESLARLQTDRIDLYQLHNPRIDTLMRDDVFAVLDDLKLEGKILAYGAALGPALRPERQVDEGIEAIRHRRSAVQIIFNMLEQALGNALLPVAAEESVALLARVPHASGLLEGGYSEDTDFAPTDHRSHRLTTNEMRKAWLLDGLKKVEKLRAFAEPAGRTLGQMAIQWILGSPAVASVLPNVYDERQLEEFASAPETPAFTNEEIASVSDLYEHDFYLDSGAPSGAAVEARR